jgi:hypothetical protein
MSKRDFTPASEHGKGASSINASVSKNTPSRVKIGNSDEAIRAVRDLILFVLLHDPAACERRHRAADRRQNNELDEKSDTRSE